MNAGRLSLFGTVVVTALALSGCNAEEDSAVSVAPTHTVIRTVTATATAPAPRHTSTRAPRHTTSSTGRASTHSVQAARPAAKPTATSTRAALPPATPRSTTTAPRAFAPAPARTTQAPRRTSVPPAPTTTATSGACTIKGNISSDGEKIYHVPGQRYYNVTKISPAKGERWFCSEQDALAAGWRKALV